MDYRNAVEVLAEIENRFDVNTLCYDGENIWPVIRLEIWTQLLSSTLGKNPAPPSSSEHVQIVRTERLFFRFIKSIVYVLRTIYREVRRWFAEWVQWQVLKSKHSHVMFFSNSEHYHFLTEGKYYNHYLDPWMEFIQRYEPCIKIELTSEKKAKILARAIPTFFIHDYSKFVYPESNVHIDNLDKLQGVINMLVDCVDLQESYLLEKLQLVRNRENLYLKVLDALHPRVVFLVNYYDIRNMALVRSCKKRGIKTIDIQHGKQGKYHGMYNHWTRIPENGYELLPDFFWVWGEESRANILQGRSADIMHHLPIVGGNLWLLKWKNSAWYNESDAEQKFDALLRQKERVILFSAQPIEPFIPDHVLDAMRKSPPGWLWLIRLHPAQIINKEKIVDFFRQSGVPQFEIEQATHTPLYSLIKKSHYHITCWSTVCYEALVFGVPTSIVHENGRVLYQDYISKDLFLYADSSADLLMQIEQCKSRKIPLETSPYIVADSLIAQKAFQAIV